MIRTWAQLNQPTLPRYKEANAGRNQRQADDEISNIFWHEVQDAKV